MAGLTAVARRLHQNKAGTAAPALNYRRINTELLSNGMRNCDSVESQLVCITAVAFRNERIEHARDHSTDDRRDPEHPQLIHRCAADEERRAGRARRIDR